MPDEGLDIHHEPATGTSSPQTHLADRGEAPDFRFTLYVCGAT